MLYLSDGHFRHKRPWRGSGLAIPVFSMRTKESVGCGDFMDLKKMVDFVSACGMHVLQVRIPYQHQLLYQLDTVVGSVCYIVEYLGTCTIIPAVQSLVLLQYFHSSSASCLIRKCIFILSE